MELDGLKQIEEVRRQFDEERKWHRKERERDATLIAELKRRLATLETDPGSTSEVHECGAKGGDGVSSESTRSESEKEQGGARRVTFAESESSALAKVKKARQILVIVPRLVNPQGQLLVVVVPRVTVTPTAQMMFP